MRPVPAGFRFAAVALMLWVGTTAAAAARLYPETLAAWTEDVSATERRIERERQSPEGFLAIDFLGDAAESATSSPAPSSSSGWPASTRRATG